MKKVVEKKEKVTQKQKFICHPISLILIISLLSIVIFSIVQNIVITGENIKGNCSDLKLSVTIPEEFKQVSPGETIIVEVGLQSFASEVEQKDIYVIYVVKDYKDNIITEKSESFLIQTKAFNIMDIYIPNSAKGGKYLLFVTIRIEESEFTCYDSFEVVEKKDAKLMSISNKIILYLIATLVIVFLVIIILYFCYKIRKVKK